MDQVVTPVQIEILNKKIKDVYLPDNLKEKANAMILRLRSIAAESAFFVEYDNTVRYIDWIVSLPWDKMSDDVLDLSFARKILDKNHYGLSEVKDRILEYISVMLIKKERGIQASFSHAPIISLVGLVGTGKTTIAYSIAEALGRKIVRIPFGGMGGSIMLRGQSRVIPNAEPGYIIKAIRQIQVKNPVILLDEIDRVSESTRSEVMGVLIELLDPEQNKGFIDNYIDVPFDLSQVIFITTSNNTKDISTAVLDRLEVIQMPSYSDEEKKSIGKFFMFPQVLADAGLSEKDFVIDDGVWDRIIRPLGYDPGIRTLQRTIEGLVRKIARDIVENKITSGTSYTITQDNIKQYLSTW